MLRRCGRRMLRAGPCLLRRPRALWRQRYAPRRGTCCRASASGAGRCGHPPVPQAAVGPSACLSMPAAFLPTPAASLAATDNPMTPRVRTRPQAPPPRALACPRRMAEGIVTECRAPASTWEASRRGTPLTRAATWRCPWGRAEFLCRWGRRRCRCSGLAPTGPRGAQACATRTARPRPSLASSSCPWAIWRPCRRPETTWDRWVEWRASKRGMRALVVSVRARITLVALVLSLLPLRPPGAALAVPPLVTHRELARVK